MTEHWWITELKQKQAIEDRKIIEKWLKNEFILVEIKQKETIIKNAFEREKEPIRIKIRKLQKQIERLEKEENKCLAKIYAGDSGLTELLKENSKE